MILALTAALAIVVQDHTALRTAPRSTATALTTLWQGDVLEVRGERAGYLKVYNYRRERGGFVRSEAARAVGTAAADAPELLAVLRFLRESRGFEPLGISYGAAYLKAAPAAALTAEPFDAIARMAERLADAASDSSHRLPDAAPHLDVVEQFGVHVRSFERNGRMQVCYDGELFRRVLVHARASAEERAHAALALTRPDCMDPSIGPTLRASIDAWRRAVLDQVEERELSEMTRSQLHARRAVVWASIAFEQARRREQPGAAAQRAIAELLAVRAQDLGDDHRSDYLDALIRVGAIRWAAAATAEQSGPLILSSTPGDPGQTCVVLELRNRSGTAPLARRCTYAIVWMASVQSIAQEQALAVAVQPAEGWRELWVFRRAANSVSLDVLSPSYDGPEEGYVELAGFAPAARRLLIAREVKARGRFSRRFEVLRLDDLALIRQASTPDLLRDFGRWQDPAWRRDTLALH